MGKPTKNNRSNNKKNSKKNSKKSSYSGRRVVKKSNKRKTSKKVVKSFDSASDTSEEMRALLNEEVSEVSQNRSFLPQNYQGNQQGISNFLAPGFNQPETITNHMDIDPLHVDALGPAPGDMGALGGLNFMGGMGLPNSTLGNMSAAMSAQAQAMAGQAQASAMSPFLGAPVQGQVPAQASAMSPLMGAPAQASAPLQGMNLRNVANLPTSDIVV